MSDFENERDNATPDELTLGEETDKSLAEKVKDIFVVVKVTVISYLMFQAILDRRSKIGRFDRVTLLLALNICVLLGLLHFEYGAKHIKGLFLLILCANYVNFQSFIALIW